jgi:hypothetical protein
MFIIHREDVAHTQVDTSLQACHSKATNSSYPTEYAPGNKLTKKEAKEMNQQNFVQLLRTSTFSQQARIPYDTLLLC